MVILRSGTLAAWACAWIDGSVALDEVVDAVTGVDAPHIVAGLPGFDGPVGLQDALVSWRRAGEGVRVVLPVAGDVRGLPGPDPFRGVALQAGEAVVGGGFGLVPTEVDRGPSSAPPTVSWLASTIEAAPQDHLAVVDAQYDLTTAIRETASALATADVAGRGEPAALERARRTGELLDLPRGFPQRAVALLAQAERMQAVLDLALADPTGGAVDRLGIAARASALRPLVVAVRRARVAGYNAGVTQP